MLEIKPICEQCAKELPFDSDEAMICTFECTYCTDCAENKLLGICPNCGGGFEKRPIRPEKWLTKYPPSVEKYHNPIDIQKHQEMVKNK